jgi:hypothetical protein
VTAVRGRNRRGALRVRDGRVQRKNNWVEDKADYHVWRQPEVRLDRRAPGAGYRHVLTIAQLRRFIALLPQWDAMSTDLDAIVLDAGEPVNMGWYQEGVIGLRAWSDRLWFETEREWVEANQHVLSLLEVVPEKRGGCWRLEWTEAQARAFTLLDVLPHEIGHHVDRLRTRSRRSPARGEPYAERFARDVFDAVWPVYGEHFAL